MKIIKKYTIGIPCKCDKCWIPNNSKFPLILFSLEKKLSIEKTNEGLYNNKTNNFKNSLAEYLEKSILSSKTWEPLWRSTVYSYPHFHSTSHELVACFSGSALIKFGGNSEEAVTLKIYEGDAVLIPAGVGHELIEEDMKFECVGAYPLNQTVDIQIGEKAKFDESLKRIENITVLDENPFAV